MENKKCSKCGYNAAEDSLEECPLCGGDFVIQIDSDIQDSNETVQSVDFDNQVDGQTEEQTEGQAEGPEDILAQEAPKADKKVKIITASVAFVLVLAIGAFAWYIFGGNGNKWVKDMEYEEIAGSYRTYDNVMYYDFDIAETELTIPSSTAENEVVLSSAEVGSDASTMSDAAAATETEVVTFDGTYKSGFTVEYAQEILAMEYVTRNNLSEEYKKYAEEQKLALDDYLGFVESKGVSESDLDLIDKEIQLTEQRLQNEKSGYWIYDEKEKEIIIYSSDGTTESGTLKIVGNAIIDPASFLGGECPGKEKFNATFSMEDETIKQEVKFYDDGNCIIKVDVESQGTQRIAGTYQADGKSVII